MRTDYIVRDKKTGRLFASIVAASKYYAISHQTIWNYLFQKYHRPNGINPPVEAISIEKLNKEISDLKSKVSKLERIQNGTMDQPDCGDNYISNNGLGGCSDCLTACRW